MLLRNFDFATKYFDYASKTEFANTSNPQINGWYKYIDSLFSALLVKNNKIYFIYGEQKILLNESHRVLIKRINHTQSEFRFIDGSNILIKFLYQLPDPIFNASPFEYIDEDDFEWEEFIAKIVNNQELQRNFVMNLMRGC